ncbi:MAG: hypothetical protein Q4C01_07805 [Clostridia bacterium]|nr:hypothetical protein [Clostridia bacterium]
MKKQKATPLKIYMALLPSEEQTAVRQYLLDLRGRINMSNSQQLQMMQDFENAILYLLRSGLCVFEALSRLSLENLGSFYKDEMTSWFPLDDGAKIYPLTMKRNWMQMFRMSAYLNEDIVPELLQIALTFTIKRFPFFATTVKKGIFWHYLDGTKKRYEVLPETVLPCSPINVSSYGTPPFRVLYYNNRISLEGFHILTDGLGATSFLLTLSAEYIRLKYGEEMPCTGFVKNINEAVPPEELANDFRLAKPDKKVSGFSQKGALQLNGKLSHTLPHQIINFEMDASALHSLSKSKGCTVNTLMLAFMILASKEASSGEGRMNFQVPVNMRKYYETQTLRNLSMYCVLSFMRSEIDSLDSLIEQINTQLSEKMTFEKMSQALAYAAALVHALRPIPLYLKWPVAKLVYGILGDRVFSNTLSNLGVLKLSPQMQPYIQKINAVLGPAISNRVTCAMATCNDTAVLAITKMTSNTDFETSLYRIMSEQGLEIKLTGSMPYGN